MTNLIEQYFDTYKFWEFIQPAKNEYIELRLRPVFEIWQKKKEFFTQVENFKRENPEIITRKGVQFFIKDVKQLERFMLWNDGWFMENVRVFYGLSKRVKTKGEIGGGYKFIRNVEIIFFDIDKKDHTTIEDWEAQFLDIFVEGITKYLQRFGLIYPTIIHSGAGRHLLYKIKKTKISDAKKRWYKSFVNMLAKQIQFMVPDSSYELDVISDFTRVFGLPGSMNVKRKKRVTILHYDDRINEKFKLRSKKEVKYTGTKSSIETPEIKKSLEWALMTHPNLPKGSVHTILLFALKLLLKEKGVEDWKNYENEMNAVRKSTHILNPQYGTESKNWHPGICINWCKEHEEWCQKNNINYHDYHNL